MLSRYSPLEKIDGVNLTYSLPLDYYKGPITIFVNGQLLNTEGDLDHPFGYTLDNVAKSITFYRALDSNDSLYFLYEKKLSIISFNNIDWSKKLVKVDFDNRINKIEWSTKVKSLEWSNKSTSLLWEVKSNKVDFDSRINKIEFKYTVCSNS